MNNKENRAQNIDSIIDSIDNISKLEAPPFFETRLRARMERTLITEVKQNNWVLKPVWVIGTFAIFCCINLVIISYSYNSNSYQSKNETSEKESFIAEYDLSPTTIGY